MRSRVYIVINSLGDPQLMTHDYQLALRHALVLAPSGTTGFRPVSWAKLIGLIGEA